MQVFRRMMMGVLATAALIGTSGLGQEIEPPFAWKGKGTVSFIGEYAIREVKFDFELAIDVNGAVRGKTRSDEGSSDIKHVFYSERVDHELPGYYSRKSVIVLVINEQGDNPMLAVFDGRLLGGRFYSAEVRIKRYEPSGETEKALGVGNLVATPIDEDYLPSSLKSALRKTMPIGTVKIEGAYQR